jgi:hypothetical protein
MTQSSPGTTSFVLFTCPHLSSFRNYLAVEYSRSCSYFPMTLVNVKINAGLEVIQLTSKPKFVRRFKTLKVGCDENISHAICTVDQAMCLNPKMKGKDTKDTSRSYSLGMKRKKTDRNRGLLCLHFEAMCTNE